jgi:hypothetical protein
LTFDRPWFFNPFAWQLLFYTGFFLAAGWVTPPASRRWLTIVCVAFVILAIPLSHFPTFSGMAWLGSVEAYIEPLTNKPDLGVLRYVHFLCLAYLAVTLLKGHEGPLRSRYAAPIVKSGQQALPVFLTGIVMSFTAGMALDVWGRSILKTLVVNAVGMGLLVLTAYLVAWFKSEPWRAPAKVR